MNYLPALGKNVCYVTTSVKAKRKKERHWLEAVLDRAKMGHSDALEYIQRKYQCHVFTEAEIKEYIKNNY